ncbi:AAA family ATPase [Arthrobacter sp. ov118]|uniref:AAA family ATPase n=1 Tax=Arthrobacter sp. ov118 TaxID=1761747 RepID=UPI0008E7790D|nr:AAA family ATPase [Arthrobacter sp. ov118]SFT44448.1 AAA domain-containing protein [Arthrobacter sp. ov118]
MTATTDLDQGQFRAYTLAESLTMAKPTWLVEGLISASITLVSGKPKSGKSALLTALIASVLSGSRFLGREVSHVGRVIVAGTDAGALDEYRDRLLAAGVTADLAGERYRFVPAVRLDHQFCSELSEKLRPGAGDLVVFDHLSDMTGDFNSQADVSNAFAAIRAASGEAAVVVLAHSSTATGPNGFSSKKPLGSTVIAAKARWLVHVERRGDDRCVVTTSGNGAAGETLRLDVGNHVSDFSITDVLSSEAKSRKRREGSKKTLDARAEQASWYEENCRGLSNAAAARRLAEKFGGKQGTWENHLSRQGWLRLLLESRSHSLTTSPPIT